MLLLLVNFILALYISVKVKSVKALSLSVFVSSVVVAGFAVMWMYSLEVSELRVAIEQAQSAGNHRDELEYRRRLNVLSADFSGNWIANFAENVLFNSGIIAFWVFLIRVGGLLLSMRLDFWRLPKLAKQFLWNEAPKALRQLIAWCVIGLVFFFLGNFIYKQWFYSFDDCLEDSAKGGASVKLAFRACNKYR